jgi:hypothetical protein
MFRLKNPSLFAKIASRACSEKLLSIQLRISIDQAGGHHSSQKCAV